MGRIERFLERRYKIGDRDDDDRFRGIPRIRHASNIGKCQRQNWYKIKRETEDEASPYFELGNRMEDLYGAVLAAEYGDFTDDQIANMSNAELVAQCGRVQQDVTCDIELGDGAEGEDVMLTGEADWVIQYADTSPIDHVHHTPGEGWVVTFADGTEREYDTDDTPPIELVIETKTSNIKWRREYGCKFEHEYQARTYMWAFDSAGEVAYIQRDDLEELVFEFRRDSDAESDMTLRAKRLHRMLLEDELPDADPPRKNICKYCDWNSECEMEGGSRWNDEWVPIELKRRES